MKKDQDRIGDEMKIGKLAKRAILKTGGFEMPLISLCGHVNSENIGVSLNLVR